MATTRTTCTLFSRLERIYYRTVRGASFLPPFYQKYDNVRNATFNVRVGNGKYAISASAQLSI